MKINAKLTLLFNSEGLHIQVYDDDSCIQFLDLELNEKQTCDALSRLGHCEVKNAEVYNLNHVGKIREENKLEFQMPNDVDYTNRKEIAVQIAKEKCPVGWKPSCYFGSRDSFFYKNKEEWARTRIYRWVAKQENEEE